MVPVVVNCITAGKLGVVMVTSPVVFVLMWQHGNADGKAMVATFVPQPKLY